MLRALPPLLKYYLASAPCSEALDTCCVRRLQSRVAKVDKTNFVYFHEAVSDIFWPAVRKLKPQGLDQDAGVPCSEPLVIAPSQQERIEHHNLRAKLDFEAYVHGVAGDVVALRTYQERLEQDMVDNAFVGRLGMLLSNLQRLALPPPSLMKLVGEPGQRTFDLLQDGILFRDEDVQTLAGSSEVASLPNGGVTQSYSALLSIASPSAVPLNSHDTRVVATQLMLAAAPDLAVLGANKTLNMVLYNLLRKRHQSQIPPFTKLMRDLGHEAVQQVNGLVATPRTKRWNDGVLTLLKLRALLFELQERSKSTALSPAVEALLDEAQTVLEAGRIPPMFEPPLGPISSSSSARWASSANWNPLRRVLGVALLKVSDNAACTVGAAIATLLLSYLKTEMLTITDPVPWKLAPDALGQREVLHDYVLQGTGKVLEHLLDPEVAARYLTPIYGPCVVPPEAWQDPRHGCYIQSTQAANRFNVSLMRAKSAAQLQLLEEQHRVGSEDDLAAELDTLSAETAHGLLYAQSSEAGEPGAYEAQDDPMWRGSAAESDPFYDGVIGQPDYAWSTLERPRLGPGARDLRPRVPHDGLFHVPAGGPMSRDSFDTGSRPHQAAAEQSLPADEAGDSTEDPLFFGDDGIPDVPADGAYGLLPMNANATAQVMLEDGGLQEVYDVLSMLSQQPWRINSKVLEVADQVYLTSEGVADTPLPLPSELPSPAPDHFHLQARTLLREFDGAYRSVTTNMGLASQPVPPVIQRGIAAEIRDTAKRNAEAQSVRAMYLLQLRAAKAHEHCSQIFFPHNIDFRGRAYPMPPHLNHMGNDLCRGILVFGESKPLGEDGFRWLMIQLANVFGEVDKAPFAARVDWTLRNMPDVLDSAQRPLAGRRWWLRGDKPWSVLAACFEIDAALRSGDVRTYECSLPVYQDGSCNGLQHYAALGRDIQGAMSVNLIDSSRPQDVYTGVARSVQAEVERAANEGLWQAAAIRGHVDRKLVKQTVMTVVYGVTLIGARDQVQNRLLERGWPRNIETRQVATYVAKTTMAALAGYFSSASAIMAWLREAAGLIAVGSSEYKGATVSWKTPLGLPVSQPYYKPDKRDVLELRVDRGKNAHISELQPSVQKQRTAFPPNYIHSLDATHMMMTARECNVRGMSFAGVHDSYWTHPSTVTECRTVLRQQFVELYKQPLLDRLYADLLATRPDLADTLQPPPAQGEFNLDDVVSSTYFFN